MKKSKIDLQSKKVLILFSFFVLLYVSVICSNHIIKTHWEEGEYCVKGILTSKEGDHLTVYAKEPILFQMENFPFQLGDSIQVCGHFKRPSTNTSFHLFSYQNYLLSKHIVWTIQNPKVTLLKRNQNGFFTLKNKLLSYVEKFQSAAYLKLFLLGNSEDIQKAPYQNLGISHLFSISGMHISFLAVFFLKVFKKRKVILPLLLFYVFLSGASPSALRAFFLFCFLSFRKTFPISYFMIYLAGIFLIINPYFIYHSGFLYSFTISFTLICCSFYLKEKQGYLKKIMWVSIFSFLSSIPISLMMQFELRPMSILFNLLYVPYITFILFPFCFLTFFLPFLDPIFSFLCLLLEKSASFLELFSFPFVMGYPNHILFLIVSVLFGIQGIVYRKYIRIIPLIIFLSFQIILPYFDSSAFFTTIDVGQGDSLLLELPYRKEVILIDTGGRLGTQKYQYPISKNILLPYLKSRGIRKLSTLILSHGDFDHMGEAIHLVNHFRVEKVIFNCGPYNDLEKELIKVLDRKHIKYYSCIKELNIDKNKLYFLQTKEYDNENDNSNVIYTELKGYKFMFMGDAGIDKEKDILEKYNINDIDVLKAGHHGSMTSSSKEFINEINPKYSIISVGKNNRYGHPNKEVLENLNNSKIYRTDMDGSIMFRVKNSKLEIETYAP